MRDVAMEMRDLCVSVLLVGASQMSLSHVVLKIKIFSELKLEKDWKKQNWCGA
jgi:hypothetical protein